MTIFDTPPPAVPDPAAQGTTDGVASLSTLAAAEALAPRRRRMVLLTACLALLVALGSVAGWYLLTHKPLTQLPGVAGLPALAQDAPHYSFSIYGTTHPLGVAVDTSGDRVYVAESDGKRLVRVFTRSGKPIGTLQPPKSTGVQHVPVYVAVNPKTDDVYVSDRITAAVYVYSRSGKYLRTFAPQGVPTGGWAPLGLAFDADGRLYATDVRGPAHRVLEFSASGKLMRSMGESNKLSFPNGIVVAENGNVFVADSNNGRVVIFDRTGRLAGSINRGVGEGDLGLPRGLAVDDSSRLFVVDTANHTVRLYRVADKSSEAPRYATSFGDEGTVDATFEYPNGVATDTRGRIYVTDRENNRVQVWSY